MTEQESKKAAILRKVQGLLAKADSTPFTEEADVLRQKADEMMTIYAIEEWQLQESGKVEVERIERRTIKISEVGSLIQQEMNDLASTISRHCRVKIIYLLQGRGQLPTEAYFIGYPSDLDFFHMLHTSLHLHMASTLEPKFDSAQTVGWNVKRMKEAGMKWERIARLCGDGEVTPKWISLYKKQCKIEGTTPMKTMPSVYVRNFAAGFVIEIADRLAKMREQTEDNIKSTGQSLVLFDTREKDINQFVKEQFQNLTRTPVKAAGKIDLNARGAGGRSAQTADLSGGRHDVGHGARKELG